MRLKDKVAIVVGAGQTPGDTIGKRPRDRSCCSLARARACCWRTAISPRPRRRAAMIEAEGGHAPRSRWTFRRKPTSVRLVERCWRSTAASTSPQQRGHGRGRRRAGHIEIDAFERIFRVNLEGPLLTCKHAVP